MRMSPVTSSLLTASRLAALAPLPSAAASSFAFSAVLQSQNPLCGHAPYRAQVSKKKRSNGSGSHALTTSALINVRGRMSERQGVTCLRW